MYKLGIVGCGMAGTSFTVAAGHTDGWTPVAAVGITPQESKAFAAKYGLQSMTLKELTASPEVDVVAVATPPGVHVETVVPCLEAGKHVIVEKPMALTLEDCDRMLAAARAGGRRLMVGQTYRFFSICKRVRTIIEEKELGRLEMIDASVSIQYFTEKRSGWQLDPKMSGGGVVMNPCIHLTDIIRHFAGSEVRAVKAMTGADKPGFDIEGHAQINYSFEDRSLSASLTLSGYGHRNYHMMRLFFDRGILEVEAFENKLALYRDKKMIRAEEPLPPPYGEGDLVYGYVSELENMAEAIENRMPLLSDGENGKRSVRVNLAVIESARTGRLVEIGRST